MTKHVMLAQLLNGPFDDMEIEYIRGEVSFASRGDSQDYMYSFSFNISADDLISIADFVKKCQENE